MIGRSKEEEIIPYPGNPKLDRKVASYLKRLKIRMGVRKERLKRQEIIEDAKRRTRMAEAKRKFSKNKGKN